VIEAVGLAILLSVLPLGVVAILAWLLSLVAGNDVVERLAVGVALIECSMLLVAGAVLFVRGVGAVPIHLSMPGIREMTLGLLFFPVVLVTMQLQSFVGRRYDVEADSSPDVDYSKPAIVLVALVLVGPAEELLYRGIVQGLLVGPLGTPGGIVVMALLFGLVHYPTYGASSIREIDASVALGMVGTSVAGAAFGTLYVLTGTLLVPIIVHSVYDALLFADLVPGVDLGESDTSDDAAA